MKVTIQKLGITIEDEEPRSAASGAPIPGCVKGYAVYAFGGTRTMRRVGGATCLFPSSGYTASQAGSHLMITSAFSSQLTNLYDGNGLIKELRFAVCCPPPASISLAKTKKGSGKRPPKTGGKRKN